MVSQGGGCRPQSAIGQLGRHALARSKVPAEVTEGLDLLKKAARGGVPSAMTAYAVELERLKDNPLRVSEARQWYLKAASGGDLFGMLNAARVLKAGIGGAADPAGARRWLQAAADKGHADSMAELASMLAAGEGGPMDGPAAREWYRKSVEGGSMRGVAAYARMLRKGEHGPVDLTAHAAGWPWRRKKGDIPRCWNSEPWPRMAKAGRLMRSRRAAGTRRPPMPAISRACSPLHG